MRKGVNSHRIIILLFIIAVVGAGILYMTVVFAPRPVLSADSGQILTIEYYDETLGDVIEIKEYNEDHIRKILEGCSEKKTMLKDHGVRLGLHDVVLSIDITDPTSVKSVCFEKDTGYTSQGHDTHWYRIKDADLALKALADELNISSLK